MRVAVQREGVMVDLLCHEALGTDGGRVVEEALTLNPGLAATLASARHALPLSTVVTLPERRTRVREIETIKLWD